MPSTYPVKTKCWFKGCTVKSVPPRIKIKGELRPLCPKHKRAWETTAEEKFDSDQ
jgi:hypothetical protein